MSISNKDLQAARTIAAEIVARLGEKYWPIFDLIDQEWVEREQRHARIAACLQRSEDVDGRDNASA